MERIRTIVVWAGGLAIALFLSALMIAGSDKRSPAQRVADSCKEQFEADGPERVNECILAIETKALQDREVQKMDAARRNSNL